MKTTGTTPIPPRIAALAPWALPAAAAAVIATSVISYSRNPEIQAHSGSPYYDKAVKEAVHGLVNLGAANAPQAAERPALPPGASLEDHYWCEQCKAYHRRAPQGAPPAEAPVANPLAPPPMLTPLPPAEPGP